MNTPLRNAAPVLRPSSVGEALLERYGLDREAARTETGVLYDATEKATKRKVSIEIANDLDDDARLAFERDAMIAQRLEGDHILRVLEVGALIDGTPFVVREPALGSLANDVATRGPLPTTEAVAWSLEICEALAEAHARGIAHGDIRAETVFLGRDGAGNPIAKVRWTSKSKAEGAAREDVAHDIAGTATLLRFLITGETGVDDDAVKTLPTELGHAVARAISKDDDTRFRNIGELAAALAKFAPAGHTAARNVASLFSRAGIVGSPVAIPVSQRMTAPNPMVPPPAAVAISEPPPPSSRRVAIRPSMPGLNEDWFAPRPSRTSDLPAAPPARRPGAFAAVSALLLAGVLGGTVYLWKNHELPQWSGTAPPMDEGKMEPVSRTEVTSGLMETTTLTAPAALEKNQVDDQKGQANAPATTMDLDEGQPPSAETKATTPATPPTTTDTKPAARPQSTPTTPSTPTPTTSPKAKTDTSDTKPAEPWSGTAAPPVKTPSVPSPSTDDTARSTPTPAPTTAPTTAPSTAPTEQSGSDSPGF